MRDIGVICCVKIGVVARDDNTLIVLYWMKNGSLAFILINKKTMLIS